MRAAALSARLFGVAADEGPAVGAGIALLFLLFTGYFMLRPVRETMGIAGGVDNLQWLFTATFAVTLLALPAFGWVASRVARRRILSWTYAFFVANLLGFAALLALRPADVWTGRVFYVWLSVFNLLAISLAWSVLADLFVTAQARRLFALMATGASLGGLCGPLAGTLLVPHIGHAGLLVFAAGSLAGSAVCATWLHRWRDRHPSPAADTAARRQPLGGNPLAGATDVLRSPYLLGIAAFVLLLATVSTFLYFEQARLVAATFPDPLRQTQVFGLLDVVVQALALATQAFLTGRIAERLGIGALLVAVPLVIAAGFLWLALSPVFAVLAVVMVVRRAGEYALVRPGREMLYTVVTAEHKYKAKNFIDTVVYRGSDALAAWLKRALDAIAEHPALVLVIGAGIALAWGISGAVLGRGADRRAALDVPDGSSRPGRAAAH